MRKRKYIRDFVKEINPEYKVFIGKRFEVDIQEEEIFITFNSDKEEEEMVRKFIKEEFGKDYPMFIISLLHEVGHIETYDEELDEDRELVYGLLKTQFEDGKADIEEYNNMYFRIPAEYEATAWAIDFYEKNQERCDKLLRKIGER